MSPSRHRSLAADGLRPVRELLQRVAVVGTDRAANRSPPRARADHCAALAVRRRGRTSPCR